MQRAVLEKWTPYQAEEAVRNLPAESPATAGPPHARRVTFLSLLRRLRIDVPVLEIEGQQLGKEEQAELAVRAQRLLRAVAVQV